YINPQFFDQRFGHRTIGRRALNGKCATEGQAFVSTNIKFVSLGMAAEVVVVLDNQNARIRILLAIEMRGRETADPAADDDEIKVLSSLNGRRGCLPKISVVLVVSSLKGPDMA